MSAHQLDHTGSIARCRVCGQEGTGLTRDCPGEPITRTASHTDSAMTAKRLREMTADTRPCLDGICARPLLLQRIAALTADLARVEGERDDAERRLSLAELSVTHSVNRANAAEAKAARLGEALKSAMIDAQNHALSTGAVDPGWTDRYVAALRAEIAASKCANTCGPPPPHPLIPEPAASEGREMKASLAGMLNNAANVLDTLTEEHDMADYYAFSLREVIGHIDQLKKGEVTLAEFAEHYCLTHPATRSWGGGVTERKE